MLLKRTAAKEIANGELSPANNIPFECFISDDTIKNKKGDVFRVYRIEPTHIHTADSENVIAWKLARQNVLKAIRDTRVSIYSYTVKKKARQQTSASAKHGADFASTILKDYDSLVVGDNAYVTEFYLCIALTPGKTGVKFLDFVKGLGKKKSYSPEEETAKNIELLADLDQICTDVLRPLDTLYSPKPLTNYVKDGIAYSEALSFFRFLIDGDETEVPVFPSSIANYVSRNRLFFGKNIAKVESDTRKNSLFGVLGIREYTPASSPRVFDSLLLYPAEMVISQSFSVKSKASAMESLERQKKHLASSGDKGVKSIEMLEQAVMELAEGEYIMGEHNLSVKIYGENKATLAETMGEVKGLVYGGHELIREDLALESAFWAALPGNFEFMPRSAPLTSRNFAGFSSFHGYPTGDKNPEWGKPLFIVKSANGQPYNFNLHVGELGHSTFIGPSRSGKTTFMTFIAMALENMGVEQVYFDKDFGAEPAIRALGGSYTTITDGEPTGLNPFQLEDNEENKQYLLSLVEHCVTVTGEEFTNEDMKACLTGIVSVFSLPKEMRTFSNFVNSVPHMGGNLKDTLSLWTTGNPLGWVFDNQEDTLSFDGRCFGYDMTSILDNHRAKGPLSNYVIRRHRMRLDGRKTAFHFDEGWALLDDAYWAEAIYDFEVTAAKLNAITLFATQMPEAVLGSSAGNAVLAQSATNIFPGNPKATREEYIDGFKLTEREFDIVRKELPGKRHYLIKKPGHEGSAGDSGESVVIEFDLSSIERYMPVLSNKAKYRPIYRKLIQEKGENPDNWVSEYIEIANRMN